MTGGVGSGGPTSEEQPSEQYVLIHSQGRFGPFTNREAAAEYGYQLALGSQFDESYEVWPMQNPARSAPDTGAGQ